MTYLSLSLTKYVENLNTEYYKTLLRKIKGLNKRRYIYIYICLWTCGPNSVNIWISILIYRFSAFHIIILKSILPYRSWQADLKMCKWKGPSTKQFEMSTNLVLEEQETHGTMALGSFQKYKYIYIFCWFWTKQLNGERQSLQEMALE